VYPVPNIVKFIDPLPPSFVAITVLWFVVPALTFEIVWPASPFILCVKVEFPLAATVKFATDAGVIPAPPPTTTAPAVKAADVANVVAESKNGTPPLVPATVKAGVVVEFATDTIPPVQPTLVTVPDPPPAAT